MRAASIQPPNPDPRRMSMPAGQNMNSLSSMFAGTHGVAPMFNQGNPFPQGPAQPPPPQSGPFPSGTLSMSDPRTMEYLRAGPARMGLAALLASGNRGPS